MSVTSGFYNGLSHDRKYNAVQMSSLFDGIINDGIFQSIGTYFTVTASSGFTVKVGIGKAWFNSHWIQNDAILPLTLSNPEVVLARIDAVIIEVNTTDSVRDGSIKILKGTPASSPVNPKLTNDDYVHQHALCYIYRKANETAITQSGITNMIGTASCPFITAILETASIDSLLGQWQDQLDQFVASEESDFIAWFDSARGLLTTDAAGAITEKISPHGIAANTDLNTLTTSGYYKISTNVAAATLLNCPTITAFEMETRDISADTGTAWRALHQIIRPYVGDKIYIRLITSNGSGVWTYGPWHTYTPSPYGNVFYGTCSTAAATTAKVVPATDFFLATGVEITVKNTIANTATAPTLNVNSTGAKPIYYHGAAVPAGYLGIGTYKLSYDGSVYNIIEGASVLTFAQDADGKWGYKVAGADPVIPFKSYYDLGTGTSFNVSSYSGYKNFSLDNFAVTGNSSVGVSWTDYGTVSNLEGVAFSHSPSGGLTQNYNANTGVLNAYVYTSEGSHTATKAVHAYLIR